MKRSVVTCTLSLLLASCVTMTPQASKVMLYAQDSTLLAQCTKIGPVSAEASGWTQMDWASVEQQAKNNLRDDASKKYGSKVDSVALVNLDRYNAKVVANGIAYKCF